MENKNKIKIIKTENNKWENKTKQNFHLKELKFPILCNLTYRNRTVQSIDSVCCVFVNCTETHISASQYSHSLLFFLLLFPTPPPILPSYSATTTKHIAVYSLLTAQTNIVPQYHTVYQCAYHYHYRHIFFSSKKKKKKDFLMSKKKEICVYRVEIVTQLLLLSFHTQKMR